jgi:hypothetical protein
MRKVRNVSSTPKRLMIGIFLPVVAILCASFTQHIPAISSPDSRGPVTVVLQTSHQVAESVLPRHVTHIRDLVPLAPHFSGAWLLYADCIFYTHPSRMHIVNTHPASGHQILRI